MLPLLRRNLKGVSVRNQPLQDILRSCTIVDEIISVTSVTNASHNTKLILKKPDGEHRVHFYNRLDISDIIPEEFNSSGNLQNDIGKLNLLGYDFTEDDLELIGGILTAKPISLGYIGALDNAVGPREISCDGATADAIIMLVVNESITQDELISALYTTQIEMNGQVYGVSDETEFLNNPVRIEGYRKNLTPDQLALVPEGWILLEAARLSNITSNPLRIKYGFSKTSAEKIKFIVLETVNPTSYIDEETGAAAFCLAPQELICKPELCYAINIDNWTGADEQYQIIYDAINHIRNTFEAEDPNANPVYVSYVDKYSEDNSVLTAYIYIRFEYNYSNNPPVNGLGGSFKVKFQLPAINSDLNWYEYDVSYGDDGAEYTLVSELGTASYARDIDACLIQIISRQLT